MKKSFGKSGFTLIELLVVISIIAVLLSVLMPALSKAKYMTKRLICLTRVKDQATTLFTYASANDGRFSPNNANGPQYMRSPALGGVYSFDAMINTYITNTEIMFCPIMESQFGSSKRYYDGTYRLGYSGLVRDKRSGCKLGPIDYAFTGLYKFRLLLVC